ncbi:bacteriohemerythrin [Geofilum sp. OHC36d9]|uniref:bacteriohemerythrin n=1 Tax=Geofilum sp. OHC36d9 TaxID=3458413 RepID=UPI0040349692
MEVNLKSIAISSFGCSEIDREHEVFLDILNRIDYVYTHDLDHEIRRDLMVELYKFLDFHFQSEENLMRIFDFPYSDEHKLDHERLRHLLADIIGVSNMDMVDLSELKDFVNIWITEHISSLDGKLIQHLMKMKSEE